MSDEEYKKMLKMYSVIERIMDKYIKEFEIEDQDPPIIIPGDIYDEICYEMGTNEIGLMGIS